MQRFQSASRQFDIARIDHFRALEAYWEIPAGATSARKAGGWKRRAGNCCEQCGGSAPTWKLVAENLGSITREVEALRQEFELPGMLILQFAFDGNPDNPLPQPYAGPRISSTLAPRQQHHPGLVPEPGRRHPQAGFTPYGDPTRPCRRC